MVGNKGGGPPGNAFALKFDTPFKRRKLLKAYIKHCEDGYPDMMFEECDHKTFKKYCTDFPVEFPTDRIHAAQMKRAKVLYDIGVRGTVGIPVRYTDPRTKAQVEGKNFNARSWQFIMMNLLGWRNRNDTTSKGDKVPGAQFVVYRPEKLPNDYDEKMNTPGGKDGTTADRGNTAGQPGPTNT